MSLYYTQSISFCKQFIWKDLFQPDFPRPQQEIDVWNVWGHSLHRSTFGTKPFWDRNWIRFLFFEKVTIFDEIFILPLTNKLVFLCIPPNFEFSVSYSSSLSGAPWDPSENYLILKSSKVGFCLKLAKKDRTNLSTSKKR